MFKAVFEMPNDAVIPRKRRIASKNNAHWILRNASINNPPEIATKIKDVVKEWVSRSGLERAYFYEV